MLVSPWMSGVRMPRNTRAEFGLAYGMIAGGGAAVVMLALTGSVWWIVFLPAVGLLVGLLVAGAPGRGSGPPRE